MDEMANGHWKSALVAALLAPLAACEPDAATGIEDRVDEAAIDGAVAGIDDAVAVVEPTDSTEVIASLTTPAGTTIRFIEVRHGDRAGVLVVEEGEEGALVLERIRSGALGPLSAADVYASLMDPANPDSTDLVRLRRLSASRADDRRPGWARELATAGAVTALAASSQIACDNASFKASISGGFLATLFKRLDTGPSYHPGLWSPYDWSGVTHYSYTALVNNTPRWGGKFCGKAGFHPDVHYFNGWRPSIPVARFLYRVGQTWMQAGNSLAFGSNAKTAGYMYVGELGPIDWKIQIYDAYVFDQFDVMMTWN
jgi:hypothetical protein